jgi:hypothetical protein
MYSIITINNDDKKWFLGLWLTALLSAKGKQMATCNSVSLPPTFPVAQSNFNKSALGPTPLDWRFPIQSCLTGGQT